MEQYSVCKEGISMFASLFHVFIHCLPIVWLIFKAAWDLMLGESHVKEPGEFNIIGILEWRVEQPLLQQRGEAHSIVCWLQNKLLPSLEGWWSCYQGLRRLQREYHKLHSQPSSMSLETRCVLALLQFHVFCLQWHKLWFCHSIPKTGKHVYTSSGPWGLNEMIKCSYEHRPQDTI